MPLHANLIPALNSLSKSLNHHNIAAVKDIFNLLNKAAWLLPDHQPLVLAKIAALDQASQNSVAEINWILANGYNYPLQEYGPDDGNFELIMRFIKHFPMVENLLVLSKHIHSDNKEKIGSMVKLMGKHEHLSPHFHDSIKSRCESAPLEANTKSILAAVYDILIHSYLDPLKEFKSNDFNYEQLTSFIGNLDSFEKANSITYYHDQIKALGEILNRHQTPLYQPLPLAAQVLRLNQFSTEFPLSKIDKLETHAQELSPSPERSQILYSLAQSRFLWMQVKQDMLMDCAKSINTADLNRVKTELDMLYNLLLKFDLDMQEYYFSHFYSIDPNRYITNLHFLEFTILMLTSGISTILLAVHAENVTQISPTEFEKIRNKRQMDKILCHFLTMREPSAAELGSTTKRPNDPFLRIPPQMHLDTSFMGKPIENNIYYQLRLFNFDQAAKLLADCLSNAGKMHAVSSEKQELLTGIRLLSLLRTTDFCQSLGQGTMNFHYFFRKQKTLFKKITQGKNPLEKNYKLALHKALELALVTFWFQANNVFINLEQAGQSQSLWAKDEKLDSQYRMQSKRQLLTFCGELMYLYSSLGSSKAQSPITLYLAQGFLSAEEFASVKGLIGFTEVLFKRLSDLNAYTMPHLERVFGNVDAFKQEQEQKLADRTYHTLMNELKTKKEELIQNSRKVIKKQKDRYKVAVNKKAANKSCLFTPTDTGPVPIVPRTPQADKYWELGRLRHEEKAKQNMDKLLDDLIAGYKTIIDPEDKEVKMDRFYHAATLKELADCYFQKGMRASGTDITQLSKLGVEAMLSDFKQALTYAQAAETFFKTQVTQLDAETIENYSDLNKHIDDMLSQASQQLMAMEKENQLMEEILEEEQWLEEQKWLQAIDDFGGWDAWKKNPQPKNNHVEKRSRINEELAQYKSSGEKLRSFITEDLAPTQGVFAYLTGRGDLPLLLKAKPGKDLKDHPLLHKGGEFHERLKFLVKTEEVYAKTGDAKKALLELCAPSVLLITDGSEEFKTEQKPSF